IRPVSSRRRSEHKKEKPSPRTQQLKSEVAFLIDDGLVFEKEFKNAHEIERLDVPTRTSKNLFAFIFSFGSASGSDSTLKHGQLPYVKTILGVTNRADC